MDIPFVVKARLKKRNERVLISTLRLLEIEVAERARGSAS